MSQTKRVLFYVDKSKIEKIGWENYKKAECAIKGQNYTIEVGTKYYGEYDYIFTSASHCDKTSYVDLVNANTQKMYADDVETQEQLLSRYRLNELLSKHHISIPSYSYCRCQEDLENVVSTRKVNLPLIAKCDVSQGGSRQMSILFQPVLNTINYPCFVQEYLDHDGLILKIYLIGRKVVLQEWEDAIENVDASVPQTTFKNEKAKIAKRTIPLNQDDVLNIAYSVYDSLKLPFLGVDVVLDKKTQKLFVIDINLFPSYHKKFSPSDLVTLLLSH
ncbi:hypothetical protein EIN_046820 [Entamoeba invadens IP1]|uniref:inositol-1,3,4-trisphosphate 5/6-kinase n=1 Tax=Entamoeba invadens IP1 TaxID=370355 RepID=A0A0A1UDA0_ENTIV|nr:hypothetical protein EIN_046820 [Entamoeba invadens IP1]ELP94419.1 hypothetical protein EIN_046820 [Entamoeba invadens IP1]|eukprot:XP_004261190.1 hypothetical protein EIN_046820 [Entamoeba invadens IP1]